MGTARKNETAQGEAGTGPLRLDRYLTLCGAGSRSEVQKLLRAGRIAVDGLPAREPGRKVEPGISRICLDGQLLNYEPYEYVMLHKPSGCITATRDARHSTVMDCLGAGHKKDLAPVGRLDRDTEGLLLLTNDGALAHRLLSPGRHVDKTYYARVQGCVAEEDAKAFARGVDIGEKRPTLPADLKLLSAGEVSEVELTLHEGKFHQVKRMFEAQGKRVLYLRRISMGGISLDPALAPGQWRNLLQEEVELLRSC